MHCPKCDFEINTNENFDCPKCGEKFWISKEKYKEAQNILEKNHENTDNKLPYKSKKIINKTYLKLFYIFLLLWIVCIIIFFSYSNTAGVSDTSFYIGFISFACTIAFFILRVKVVPDTSINKSTNNCPNCDKNDDDAKYCIYCGHPLHRKV